MFCQKNHYKANIAARTKIRRMDPALNFCSVCAAPVVQRVPPGDSLPRGVCESCGTVHYRNPRLIVGALPIWEDKVLLCKRAIEPQHGKWTLPAGFMENGESVEEAAIRETLEEACARIELGPLFAMISVPYIHQVHVIYRAQLLDLDFAAGDESLEVRLFDEAEIPWSDIAFRTIRRSLKYFFSDRQVGAFGIHTESLSLPPSATLQAVLRKASDDASPPDSHA